MKKALSLFLSLVMLFGTVAIGGSVLNIEASAEETTTTYKTGDTLYFGSYPQTDVTGALGETLTALAGDNKAWTSYGYYSGTGTWDDGQMVASDYMRYTDIAYNGNKYRGVTFDSYRPRYTGSTSADNNSFQDDNGYTPNNVYWFKFEPIKWRVLDPDTGLVRSEMILDCQAFRNYVINTSSSSYDRFSHFGNEEQTIYASDYVTSDIRKWLNEDFYNTAFSDEQKSNILTTELNNDGFYTLEGTTGYEAFDCASTNDKIFLLSYNDITNGSYGFSSEKDRQLKGSDYAKSQGLRRYFYGYDIAPYCSAWILRTPGAYSQFACSVGYSGTYGPWGYDAGEAEDGVVPALRFENLKTDYPVSKEITKDTELYYGVYPQSKVTDTAVLSALNAMNLNWHSYNYYDENKTNSIMDYTDVDYNGNRYRGVKINSYRTESVTGSINAASHSYQDDNGYTAGNTYWFLWEPIKWTAIPFGDKYCLITDIIIDSQPFQSPIYDENGSVSELGKYQSDGKTNANVYSSSTIKAFIDEMQAEEQYQFNGVGVRNIDLYCEDISSVKNYDTYTASGSDYAKCQGLDCTSETGNSPWYTGYSGSAYDENGTCCYRAYGSLSDNQKVSYTSVGTRLCIYPDKFSNTIISDSFPASPENHNLTRCVSDKKGNHTAYCTYCDYYEIQACTMSDFAEVIPPNCTKAGVNESKCTLCGYAIQSEGAPANGTHDWVYYSYNGETEKTHLRHCGNNSSHKETEACTFDDGVVTKEPTCTKTGIKTYTCSLCNGTYTEEIDMVSHTPAEAVKENEKAPICTADGSYDSVVYCSECGKELSRETKATDATGHTFTSYVSNNDATCTEDGTKTAKCDNCDETDTAADTGSMLGHSFTSYTSNNDAACTEDGTKTAKCDRCDETDTVADEGTAKGHTIGGYSYTVTVPATCTEDGTSRVDLKCADCGTFYYDMTGSIPATGHKAAAAVKENEKAATCTEDGSYDEVIYCSECGEKLSSEAKTIPASGHTADGYNQETVTKPATCTEEGTVRYDRKCTVCGEVIDSMTGFISATGHVDKNKDGKCDVCGVVTDENLANPTRNAKINVAAAKTVDYKTKVTIKATATGVPEGYYLAIYVNGKQVAKGSNTEVTYESGSITSDINYTVKVIDAKGNVQKDANSKDLTNDGGKITCKAGFIQKLIAFFKGLFGSLPVVTIKP